MNTKDYMTIINSLVDDVIAEKPETLDDAMELLHQFVDGTSTVIYYSQAWELIKYLRDYEPADLTEYEAQAADVGTESFESLNHYCTIIAYWALFTPAWSLIEKELEEMA